MSKLSIELAEAEVNKWIEARKTRDSVIEANKDNITALIDGFKDGLLSLNEDNTITQTLLHPIEGLKTIKYKDRLSGFEKQKHTSRAGSDVHSQIIALLAALSCENSALLNKLDTDDIGVIRSLTSFFF